MSISYCKGYKYQLRADAWIKTNLRPATIIYAELVTLFTNGWLRIKKYFAWDGCSGPTKDTKTNAIACLAHDALCYLMRMGVLSQKYLTQVDEEVKRLMLRDGAFKFRAKYYRKGLKLIGGGYAKPKNARKVYTAP